MDTPMKLNLGCGARTPTGWVNVDNAAGARFANIPFFSTLNRYLRLFSLDWDSRISVHDLRKPFPWPAKSADVIYASHVLEHFTRDEARVFLARCRETLKPGGIIRILVPDLHYFVREYRAGRIRADDFVEKLGVLYHPTNHPIKDLLAPFVQVPHKCMYDASALLAAMAEAGIPAVTRMPWESAIDDVEAIELSERTHHAIIAEGRRA
jgi:predicted SAM-dependent methyltransferase